MSREAQKTIPTVGEGGVTYMTIRKKMALPAAAALLVLAMMVVASSAMATHVRPKGASPFYASTVPAFQTCAAPNRTHAPPLAFPSCNPPVTTSPNLTIGAPDANGAAASSSGFVKVKLAGSDVQLTTTLTDVRCKSGVAACGTGNAADGPDYSGELRMQAPLRATDMLNPSPDT